jgi:hypothetical protein
MSVQALSCAMGMSGVTASEKLLLLVLANYADDSMTCWPSHKRLADDTCLSQRTVLTLLKALEERGVVDRKERLRKDGSRSSDSITLHLSGEVISPPPEIGDTGVGKLATPGGEMVSPLTTFEPTIEPSVETDDVDAGEPDWDARLEEATRIAGSALDLTQAALWTYRDLRALCEPRSGEPCEWDEVLDAIRFRSAKVSGRAAQKIRSWTWVKDQALAYRDRRLAGLRAPEAVATGPPNSFLAEQAAINAEARRRVLESD